MRKIATYTVSLHAYNIPYTRTANLYESDTPVFKGGKFEVSTHTGGIGVEWEFRAFKTITEATLYALKFLAPSDLHEKLKIDG